MTTLQEARRAALNAYAAYTALRATVVLVESPEGWADLLDTAASWANAARAWLAVEHDARAELKVGVITDCMNAGHSRSAAEKALEEHPTYREAVARMREAERMVAVAEARQRHADLRAQAAMARTHV